jgi:hypothetical protein
MKIVLYFSNGMEAKTLTEKQVELLRRAVMAFVDERIQVLTEASGAVNEGTALQQHFHTILEIDDDITTLESIRDILFTQEVYEKAKEA